jgi:hypothetical protein
LYIDWLVNLQEYTYLPFKYIILQVGNAPGKTEYFRIRPVTGC